MWGIQLCRACLRAPAKAGPSRLAAWQARPTSIRSYTQSPRDPTRYPPIDHPLAAEGINTDDLVPEDLQEQYECREQGEEQQEQEQQDAYTFDLPDPDLPPDQFGLRRAPVGRNPYPAMITVGGGEETAEMDEDELEAFRASERRRRKTEAKRRQKGGFSDHIVVEVRGGKGGSGAAAFGLTKNGSLGPPAGGNGGSGGSVYLTTSPKLTSLHTLSRSFIGEQGNHGGGDSKNGAQGADILLEVPIGTVVREIAREGDEEKHWEQLESAEVPMEDRRKIRWSRWFTTQTGHEMEDSYLNAAERLLRKEKKWVTRTPTFEEIPPVVYDLGTAVEEPIMIARGGSGGMGNPFFHGLYDFRAPRMASRGITPYTSTFEIELKILADVGLVGFPNAGKSTILRALTGSRAEVASYQFTTLNPQVGVVRVWDDGSFGGGGLKAVVEDTWKERSKEAEARAKGEYIPLDRIRTTREIADERENNDKIEAYRFTISDNPGLLPQASENVGLGHSFLRSIERSLALAYILDLTRPNPGEDLLALRNELETYKAGLASKGAVVVLNKGDEVSAEDGREKIQQVRGVVRTLEEGGRVEVVTLSGKYGLGMEKLVKILGEKVVVAREELQKQEQEEEQEVMSFYGGGVEAGGWEDESGAFTKEELEDRDIVV